MLAADHERVRQLAEEFQSVLEEGGADLRALALEICHEIELHGRVEEELLYPAAARISELTLLVEQAHDDHTGLHELIREIRDLQPDDDQLAGLVLQLAEEVEEHAGEEEGVLFLEIEQRMGAELEQIGMQMEALKRRLTAR
jgi:hemerythrin-like domain-containing protein